MKNWAHQEKEFREHRDEPARAWLWQMRTGKSKALIDLSLYAWEMGVVDCVLLIAPNGVHQNWVLNQLPEHGGGIPRPVAWVYPEREDSHFLRIFEDLLKPQGLVYCPWFCVNSESLQFPETRKAIGRFIKDRRFMLGVDECDDFGSPGSARSRVVRALGRRSNCTMRRILTGTLAEDSPLAVFSQYEILQTGALGFTTAKTFNAHFAEFDTSYGKGGRQFQQVVGYKNLDELKDRMAPYTSVVLREDCEDMPPLLRTVKAYRPSPEQFKAYDKMREELSLSTEDGATIDATETAVRLIKLQQILSGYIIDKEGNIHGIPGGNPRLDTLASEILLEQGKAIVFCRFQEDVRRVSARLRAEGHKVFCYYGGMANKEKMDSVSEFQRAKGEGVFVATPIRGLELIAKTIYWYSHTFWNKMRRQADERATKMGGSAVSVVDMLAKGVQGGVDSYILANQAGKASIAEDLSRGGLKLVLERVAL